MWLPSVYRLRAEVCFPFRTHTTKRKRNPNQSTAHRQRAPKQEENSRPSLEEIESKMREMSRNQLVEPPANEGSTFHTPVRQSQVPTQVFSTLIPPMPDSAIQISAFTPEVSTKSEFQGDLGNWEPTLEKYRNWIEMTN